MISTRKKFVLGIFSTILLGAIGSGLWDIVLKSFYTWLGRELLTFVTLGLSSVKNSIYQDIAKGLHEIPSLRIFLYLIVVIFTLCSTPVVLFFLRSFALKLRDKLDTMDNENLTKKLSIFVYILFIVQMFCISILLVRFLMLSYTNSAITHFQQSYSICRPYLGENEDKMIASRFSQIKNKDDYISVISKLELIAKKNNITLPTFYPW